MMGSLPAQQNSLFYDFRLEQHLSGNYFLCHIDRILDFDRIEENHNMKPKRLIADTAYGSAHCLNYLVTEKNTEPHIPDWDKSLRTDGSFSASDFVWFEELDRYECPKGKLLLRSVTDGVIEQSLDLAD